MQPYQEASEERRRQGEAPFKDLKSIASIAGKVAPFLSSYVPAGLALKGLGRVDKRLEQFINTATGNGRDPEEIRQFIGDKVKRSSPPQRQLNLVEQISPELHQFILNEIKSGRSPVEAGALAQLDRRGQKSFKSAIKKIEEANKAPWSAILNTVYGQAENQQTEQGQEKSTSPGMQRLLELLQQRNR